MLFTITQPFQILETTTTMMTLNCWMCFLEKGVGLMSGMLSPHSQILSLGKM